ncbi:Oxidoreductase domain protein [beta proteobacterium CB]|nr:Oxidoreductase domain protein [beta proteobacterium CB]
MNILIIGLGSIGIRHLINFHALNPGANFFALRQTASQQIKSHPGFEQTIPDYQTITSLQEAKDLNPALVVIANPSTLHAETAVFFYEETSAIILLEKPCACNFDQLALFDQLENPDRILVVQQLRFNPLSALIKKIISSNVMGSLYRFTMTHSEHISLWHPWEDYRNSYAVQKALGGGSFLTQNHGTDLMFYLLGKPDEYVTILGDGSHLKIDCDEMFTSSLRYDQPTGCTLGSINGDYLRRPPVMEGVFEFDRGQLRLNFRTAQIEATVQKRVGRKHYIRSLPFERNTQYLEMARAVLAYCHSRDPLKVDHRLVPLKEARTILRLGFSSVAKNFSF